MAIQILEGNHAIIDDMPQTWGTRRYVVEFEASYLVEVYVLSATQLRVFEDRGSIGLRGAKAFHRGSASGALSVTVPDEAQWFVVIKNNSYRQVAVRHIVRGAR